MGEENLTLHLILKWKNPTKIDFAFQNNRDSLQTTRSNKYLKNAFIYVTEYIYTTMESTFKT